VAIAKKKPLHPGLAGPGRKKGTPARRAVVLTDVTRKEKQAIFDHCVKNKISVSQYLSDLTLADIKSSDPEEEEEITLRLPRSQMQKLRLLARIAKKSPREFLPELLSPPLANKQPHGPLETENLRFYVTPDEHAAIRKHISKKGISARNYIALLAVEDLAKHSEPTAPLKKK
jgi:hypothetical protein